MNPTLAAGLLMGVLCGLWTFVMGFTGWYKDPDKASAFFVVIAIEIGVLIWGLTQTARKEGRTYSGQVVAGTMMSIIGGVVIIGFSLLFTTVAFPDYFKEIEGVQRAMLQQQGLSEPEIATTIANASGQTPMLQALAGFLGTFVTGVMVSAVLAIWVRARPGAAQVSRSRV